MNEFKDVLDHLYDVGLLHKSQFSSFSKFFEKNAVNIFKDKDIDKRIEKVYVLAYEFVD